MRYIERDLPIEGLNAIAEKEGNAKKPIYQIHKWWARRLGSVFRMLILAAFTEWDDSLSPEENQRRLWSRFYSKNELKKQGRQATHHIKFLMTRAHCLAKPISPMACLTSTTPC